MLPSYYMKGQVRYFSTEEHRLFINLQTLLNDEINYRIINHGWNQSKEIWIFAGYFEGGEEKGNFSVVSV